MSENEPTGIQSEKQATQDALEGARQDALRRLAARTEGSLTLDEYAERAAAIEAATTLEEVDASLRGLDEQTWGRAPTRHASWLVAVFGGMDQRGRWRLSRRLRVLALFGGVHLDLGSAEPEATESRITIFAILGGVDMLAPPGVPMALSGFSLLGGRSDERSARAPLRGAPLVRVRAFALLGGVKIKDRAPSGDLLDLIRARSTRAQASAPTAVGPASLSVPPAPTQPR